eukprot:5528443-Pyramimonas_sp.AAC.1
MVREDGPKEFDRKRITDMFADFYELFYTPPASNVPEQRGDPTVNHITALIPPFTQQELDKTVKDLKTGKANDKSGIVAEMIKHGGRALER